MKALKVTDFPDKKMGKEGWPWDHNLEKNVETDSSWPRISVVTPNYNQGSYIEETIRSVLLQGYPNLEYIVIDGASTDNSVDIIKKYEPWIDYWVSEPDSGQVDAINKGFRRAGGEWLAFINSDDLLYPDALFRVAEQIKQSTFVRWIAGYTVVFGENGEVYRIKKPDQKALDRPSNWITYAVQVPQQSSFIHRSVLDDLGMMDDSMHFAFDLEYWLRMSVHQIKPQVIHEKIAGFRIHDINKSSTSRLQFLDEQEQLIPKYSEFMDEDETTFAQNGIDHLKAEYMVYKAADLSREKGCYFDAMNVLAQALALDSGILKKRYFWGAVRRVIF